MEMKGDRHVLAGFDIDITPKYVGVSTNENSLPRDMREEPHLIRYQGYARDEEGVITAVRKYFRVLREEGMITPPAPDGQGDAP